MKTATEHIGNDAQRARLPRQLLCCMVICFVTNLGSYMRIPVLPLLATSLGADSVRVGLINSAFMLSAGLLCVPAGLLSDRIGRRKLITWGLLILSVSSFLLYGSSDLLQMAAAYLLFGAGLAAFTPTLLSHVVDITPPERLGLTYGLYSAVLHCGLTIGPAAGGFLGRAVGLRQVFLASGTLILFMFLFAMAVLPRDIPHRSAAGEPMAYRVLWRELLRNRALLACLVTSFGFSISTGVFTTFIPLYLHDLGMNAGHVGLVFAGQALANGFSRIPLGRLADRSADRAGMTVVGLAGFALSIAVFGMCHSLVPLVLCATLLGVFMGAVFSTLMMLIGESVPNELRGVALGGYYTFSYFGMMLNAVGMGFVIRATDFRSALFLTGIVTLEVTALFHFLYRKPDPLQMESAEVVDPSGV